jgi:hypothetical protein
MGASIATIGRNTAAALGIAFGYLAIVEPAIRGLRPSWSPWLLGDNSVVVITNQTPEHAPGRPVRSGGGDAGRLLHPSPAGSGPVRLPPTRHHLTRSSQDRQALLGTAQYLDSCPPQTASTASSSVNTTPKPR